MTAPASATQRVLQRACTERQLMDAVIECAERLGWRCWHDTDSRRNKPGLPDLILVRGGELIFAELKTSRGQLRAEQREWLEALGAVMDASENLDREWSPVSVCLWRPADWLDGTIERRLA